MIDQNLFDGPILTRPFIAAMLWTKHFLCIVHRHCFHKKTILKESISFSNEKRSLSYSCWKGFALISVIWRFLLRWVNCFIDKAPPDCKDKHRNFQINSFYIHLKNYSIYEYYSTTNHLSINNSCIRNWLCCSD